MEQGNDPLEQSQVDVPLCSSTGSGANGIALSSLPDMERCSPPCNTACIKMINYLVLGSGMATGYCSIKANETGRK